MTEKLASTGAEEGRMNVEQSLAEDEPTLETQGGDDKKEAETTEVEADMGTDQGKEHDIVVLDDDLESPKKKQSTRRMRVSKRISEITAEKKKMAEVAEESTRRVGPRVKRAHTQAEIDAFTSKRATPEAEKEQTDEDADEVQAMEAERAEILRKRKGKQIEKGVAKKARKPEEDVIPEPISVPFGNKDEEDEDEETESETEEEAEEDADPEEIPSYDQILVEVDQKLIGDMRKFKDGKMQSNFSKRTKHSKQMKTDRRLHLPLLQELDMEDRFRAHIEAAGFEWLLDIPDAGVPVELAQEFFATFKFKHTVDLDEKCISFRAYGTTMKMSLNEWSVRMGLYTAEEAVAGAWADRDIGLARNNPEFDEQEAWEDMTNTTTRFKTSQSKGLHIADHSLRFAQLYIAINFLGQASTAATLTKSELYLMWCMKKSIKVHLGFRLAYACSQIATCPGRHMTICHLLVAFIQRNFELKWKKGAMVSAVISPPSLFDTPSVPR